MVKPMETLNLIYWYRVGLGIVAALISVAGWALTNTLFASILEAATLAIAFYIITYYILKMKFIAKVEKTSKLFTTGIGAYFLTWVISWVLILSLTAPTAAFVYSSNPTVGQPVWFDATASYDIKGYVTSYLWFFGDNQNQTGNNAIVTHVYAAPGNYSVWLFVTDNDGLTSSPQTVIVEVENITA
jgi:PKD repeat protein